MRIIESYSESDVWVRPPAAVRRQEKDTEISETEYLIQLKQKYPHLRITITDAADQTDIKKLALSQKGSFHVFLDGKLLKRMAADSSVREKYEGIMDQVYGQQLNTLYEAAANGKMIYASGVVLDSEGNVSLYTAETKKNKLPDTGGHTGNLSGMSDNAKKSDTSPILFTYRYNCGSHLARLAQARSISNVRGVISQQYAEMSRARYRIKNRAEAAVTLGRIRSVISKGNIKIARLHKEEALAARCRIALHREQEERERQLRQELREKRTARKAQEACDALDFKGLMDEQAKSDYRYRELQKESEVTAPDAGFQPVQVGALQIQLVSPVVEIAVSVDISI